MIALRRLLAGLRALLFSSRNDQELVDELRQFEEAARQAGEAAGMDRDSALRRARLQTGGIAATRDLVRDSGWESVVTSIGQDVRHACRMMRKAPAFSIAAIVTLGLGIGGTTAVFSVVDALYFRPPAGVADPGSVRRVYVARDSGSMRSPDGAGGMWPDADAIRSRGGAFAGVAAYTRPQPVSLGRGASARRVNVGVVSAEFFTVTGATPALGRFPTGADDAVPGASPVVVISHGMWHDQFGGDVGVLGRTLLLNNQALQVIGVASPGFRGVDPDAIDVWIPSAMARLLGLESTENWRTRSQMSGSTRHIARLLPNDSADRAAHEASVALAHAAEATPDLDPTPEVILYPITLASIPGPSWALDLSLWMLIAAGLVLVVSCGNVVNLLLARGVARRKELAVRMSLGAGALRVVRQQLTESLVLGLCGGAAGVAIAWIAMAVMEQFPLPPTAGHVDPRLLGFAVGLTVLTSVAFGVVPAVRARRIDPVSELKGSAAPGALSSSRPRLALVVVQVTLSFVLLVGAALFVRSLDNVSAVRGGADLDRLLTVKITLPSQATEAPSNPYLTFFDEAAARLATLPGVERTALVHTLPFAGWGFQAQWSLEGGGRSGVGGTVNVVGPGYFETAGTPLVSGRTFLATDRPTSELVTVVNDAMARLIAEDGHVLGQCVSIRTLYISRQPCVRIVGIVASQRDDYLEAAPAAIAFLPEAQVPVRFPRSELSLLVRTVDDAASRRASVHAALQSMRDDLPFVTVEPLSATLTTQLQPLRLGATLFSLFGVLALVLSALGLYGVLGYFVAERTGEVGIRRALGARSDSVVALVVQHGLVPVGLGVALGIVVAAVAARVIESRLFGVSGLDGVAFVSAGVFLVAVALVATVVPAVRAIRIDPMAALRRL